MDDEKWRNEMEGEECRHTSAANPAAAPGGDSQVTLREVTRDTVRAVCRLKVSEYQNQFVAPNAVSIAQAYFDRETAWFRAVYADDTPVGFVMLQDDPEHAECGVWRFMIDERYQGMGFGLKAGRTRSTARWGSRTPARCGATSMS